jgi:hypothetical protein
VTRATFREENIEVEMIGSFRDPPSFMAVE